MLVLLILIKIHLRDSYNDFFLVSMVSPANNKLRMTTLHEEQLPLPRKHSLDLLHDVTIEEQSEEGQDDKYNTHVSILIPLKGQYSKGFASGYSKE